MKTFLLFSFNLLFFVSIYSQEFIVNTPQNIADPYCFSPADFGANLLENTWTADALFVDDGVVPVTDGCSELVNAEEIAGKIALIDRGRCPFVNKCWFAQEAGAIAAVIFDSIPGNGSFVMEDCYVCDKITIPVMMLSYEDGQIIRAELANEPVNITIGLADNDLAIHGRDIMVAPLGVVPADQIETGDFIFSPGAVLNNMGVKEASNPTVTATINYIPKGGTSTQVYQDSNSIESLLPDSSSNLINLPAFDPAPSEEGTYKVTYEVSSDSLDTGTCIYNQTDFTFTLSDNVYSKSGWDDENHRPAKTKEITISGGGNIEFLSNFHIKTGIGNKLDRVQFYVETSAENLAGMLFESYVYEWQDINGDSRMNNDEIEPVAIASKQFEQNYQENNTWLELEYTDFATRTTEGYDIPKDNVNYFIGVRYQGTEYVYFGFDEGYDYTQYFNYLISHAAFTEMDYPYIAITSWDDSNIPNVESGFLFYDFLSPIATALVINPVSTSSKSHQEELISFDIYPNPAIDNLTIDLNLEKQFTILECQIIDASGRIFHSLRNEYLVESKISFDVNGLPSGEYFVKLISEKEIGTKAFIKK